MTQKLPIPTQISEYAESLFSWSFHKGTIGQTAVIHNTSVNQLHHLHLRFLFLSHLITGTVGATFSETYVVP